MSRNKLLASIVEALGGTVTNRDNRNQLLRDWLAVYDKRWYTQFDPGYVDLGSPKVAPIGGKIKFKFVAPSSYGGVVNSFFDSNNDTGKSFVFSDGKIYWQEFTVTTVTLDGSPIVFGTVAPTDEDVHELVFDGLTTEVSLITLFASSAGGTSLQSIGFNFEIYNAAGELLYSYPLDDISTTIARETVTPDGEELYDFANVGGSGVGAGATLTDLGDGYEFDGSGAATGDDGQRSYINLTTEVGKAYKFIASTSGFSSGGSAYFVRENPNGTGAILDTGTLIDDVGVSTIFVATTTATSILFDSSVDNSVYEVYPTIVETTDAQYIDVQESDKTQELP